jgi:hypothetical protein
MIAAPTTATLMLPESAILGVHVTASGRPRREDLWFWWISAVRYTIPPKLAIKNHGLPAK